MTLFNFLFILEMLGMTIIFSDVFDAMMDIFDRWFP
jgi:hypothetical protein